MEISEADFLEGLKGKSAPEIISSWDLIKFDSWKRRPNNARNK